MVERRSSQRGAPGDFPGSAGAAGAAVDRRNTAAEAALPKLLSVAGTTEIFEDMTARLEQAVTLLTRRLAAETAMEPLDLLRALGGIALLQPGPDWRASAVGFVDIVIAGLKADQTRPPIDG